MTISPLRRSDLDRLVSYLLLNPWVEVAFSPEESEAAVLGEYEWVLGSRALPAREIRIRLSRDGSLMVGCRLDGLPVPAPDGASLLASGRPGSGRALGSILRWLGAED